MWIVRLALRRPYTFVVMAMLIVIGGIFSILEMPTDILPEINIPVIAIVWQYGGLPPDEMEQRFTGNFERALTTTVAGIEHIESQALYGVSVTKVFFHPGTKIEMANAQVTAISQTLLKQFPVGATPPLIVNYSASNVPILQGSIHSDTLSEQELFDMTSNFLRTGLATVQGVQMPYPYGGKQRQVMIDIDAARLYAMGLSPNDVNNAIQAQNLILPSGTIKVGRQELLVRLNSSPDAVRDGGPPRQDHQRVHGDDRRRRDRPRRLRPADEHGPGQRPARHPDDAAEERRILDARHREPHSRDHAEPARDAPDRVQDGPAVRPVCLRAGGRQRGRQGGGHRCGPHGADDPPLPGELEEHRHRRHVDPALDPRIDHPPRRPRRDHQPDDAGRTIAGRRDPGRRRDRRDRERAPQHGDEEADRPRHPGRGAADRRPCVRGDALHLHRLHPGRVHRRVGALALHAARHGRRLRDDDVLLPIAHARADDGALPARLGDRPLHSEGDHGEKRNIIWRIHERFNVQFERLRRAYGGYLDWALDHGKAVSIGFGAFVLITIAALFPRLGTDFFPSVDAGQIRFHVRTPPGTRIETTEQVFARVEDIARSVVPKDELETIIDNIGLPISGLNLSLGDPSMISSADGEVLIQLGENHHPTPAYVKELRRRLPLEIPGATFFFLAPDITTQVLNFGLTAPIDVQIAGPLRNNAEDYAIGIKLREKIAAIRGAVDVHLAQVVSEPELRLNVDRTEASQEGITQRDVANDTLVSLSSSGQVAPSYWLDVKKGIQYLVAVMTPQYKIDSMEALRGLPVHLPNSPAPQLLGNIATVKRDFTPVNVTHYNVLSTFDVQANVQGTDLGSVATKVDEIIAEARKTLPRGTTIVLRGQVESMNASFRGLSFGIIAAVLLVYLLMVVNFQSWLDPLIILMALPGAIAGIVWMLFATGTTLSVPALMGAIMSIGVATSNSILMVTFANDQRKEGDGARRAAWLAGITRLRPVMMTALAMIIGMLPMSLGLGEGGEQNAPLGRAVIGGLAVATFTTLFFVPVVYSSWRKKTPRAPNLEGIEA